jgi:hypothetical protein
LEEVGAVEFVDAVAVKLLEERAAIGTVEESRIADDCYRVGRRYFYPNALVRSTELQGEGWLSRMIAMHQKCRASISSVLVVALEMRAAPISLSEPHLAIIAEYDNVHRAL